MLALGAGLAAGGCDSPASEGMSKDEIVAEYVAAVQSGDRSRLVELHNPRLDDTSEIDSKIGALGNRQWSGVRVEWLPTDFPKAPVARISATGPAGQSISDTIALSTEDDVWYLDLGTRTPRPGDPVPAGTDRPSPAAS